MCLLGELVIRRHHERRVGGMFVSKVRGYLARKEGENEIFHIIYLWDREKV